MTQHSPLAASRTRCRLAPPGGAALTTDTDCDQELLERRHNRLPVPNGAPPGRLGGVLNGGILATLIDCHGASTAIAEGRRARDESANDVATVVFASGFLSVSDLQPVRNDAKVDLTARITERTRVARGELWARGNVLVVRGIRTPDAEVPQAIA